MATLRAVISRDLWITTLFSARAGDQECIVRCSLVPVDRLIGRQRDLDEGLRRDLRAAENAGQVVV